MRKITTRRWLSFALGLMTVFASFGEVTSSASRGASTSVSKRMHHSKRVRSQAAQSPAPTPTPPMTTPLPAVDPPGKSGKRAEQAQVDPGQTSLLGGGTLTGRIFSPTQPNLVNLTTEGELDWAHWGNGGPTAFNHKNGTQQISNFTVIGNETVFSLADNPTGFTWTDGTPTASATNVHTGVFLIGVGNGFEFTVPADTNVKTFKINLGLWRARGMLKATLSDGSAGPFIDSSLVNETGTSNGLYTISFAAASAGQTLTIRYTGQTIFHSSGNVTLESASLMNGADPDQFPIINISSPADEATFNSSDSTTIFANAFDIDGSIASVDFYVDGILLGPGVPAGSNQYSVLWPAIYPGPHTLTAVATDNKGGKAFSEPVNVTALQGSGGVLQGSVFTSQANHTVNLTTQGTLDWAHWGMGGPGIFNHKNGVTQQISNMQRLGNAGTSWFLNNITTSTWTDGTPTATASTQNGILTNQIGTGGEGFQITVPADTNLKTLKLYVGSWVGIGRLEAAISDGSAPTYVDTSVNSCSSGVFEGAYTVVFKAASAGQTLRIRYTLLTDCDGAGTFGNVTLKSATLSSGGDPNNPPAVSITSPLNGAIVNTGETLPITANATDDGTITKVEFFQGATKLGEDLTSPYSFDWTNVPSGSYTLTAKATDNFNVSTTSAPIAIQANAAPVVSAGYPQSLTLPATTTLYGSASDDGIPVSPGALTLTWTKTSGPGTVSFGTPNAAVTTASFSSEGDYVLRLTATDGNKTSFSEVTVGAHPATTINLTPNADAHVRDGASANTNFGTATTIEVQTSGTTGDNRDAYFKFDLGSVGDINNAKLRIFASTSAAGSVTTSVYPVSNTSWTEAAINWNNRPALGSPVLSSVTVTDTTFQWYELDVTNYLVAEKLAGRNIVTLALHNPSNSTVFVRVNSKEAASNKPQLAVVTPETTFVQDKTLGTIRNNLTGFVGMKFTVGTAPVTVTSLGRIYVNGNNGTHTVKLVNAATGVDIPGGSVSINMSTGTPSNGFKYAALAAPVILSANTAYYLASQETSGGDQWYDSNTVLTTTAIGVVNNAVSRPNNTWVAAGGANNSFGPVDFKYASTTSPFSETYHLHAHGSPTLVLSLDKAPPDTASLVGGTGNLKNLSVGEYPILTFDTLTAITGKPGYIPAGATVTFTVWMRNSGTTGTIFPRAKLHLNSLAGTNICTATGTTALNNTLTKYTLTCTTSTTITTSATDRYHLWVGVNLTGTSNKNFTGEFAFEGTLNGNYDSKVLAPLPLTPTINQLAPSIGPTGTAVTINGANFGPLQGTSSVTFSGVPATISSWSANAISTTVPATAITGPVVVTVNGIASTGVTFTIGPADSDSDGLPDAWELQYFGNLLQGPSGDPDGDGVSNLLEFLQGRNPSLGTVTDPNSVNLKLFPPLDP